MEVIPQYHLLRRAYIEKNNLPDTENPLDYILTSIEVSQYDTALLHTCLLIKNKLSDDPSLELEAQKLCSALYSEMESKGISAPLPYKDPRFPGRNNVRKRISELEAMLNPSPQPQNQNNHPMDSQASSSASETDAQNISETDASNSHEQI